MTNEEKVYQKLHGYCFIVEEDPDYPDFYSVFCDKNGSGCEIAGKIGEKEVAETIAAYMNTLCKRM